ncbi:MAG: hypothetical protein WA936_11260 [Erythrobacter sp.]|uniref:hypothetical protein n=1 Tax=Erythrobacter sp. TaxID=1042 RepID=UPI003C77F704
MKFAKLALLATSIAAMPIAAHAQDVGTTVYGNDEAAIGTVTAADGTTVTVDTGNYKAPLPANALAEREGRWTVNATKAQIDQMMEQQVAQANQKRDAALMQGAAVTSADGQPAGTIYSIDNDVDAIIVQREGGIITLKREHFAVDPNGSLMALFSMEQLAANTVEVPDGAEISTTSQAATIDSDVETMEGEMEDEG